MRENVLDKHKFVEYNIGVVKIYKSRDIHNFLVHNFGSYEFLTYTRCTNSKYDDIAR